MEMVWRPAKGMVFKKIGENVFLFTFTGKKDYDRVLEGAPWSFDKNLLMVKENDGVQQPSQITFTEAAF